MLSALNDNAENGVNFHGGQGTRCRRGARIRGCLGLEKGSLRVTNRSGHRRVPQCHLGSPASGKARPVLAPHAHRGPSSREMAQKWGVRGQKTKDRRPMSGEVRTDLPPHATAGLHNAWRGSVRRQTFFAQSPTSDLRPTPLPPRLSWLTSWRSEQSDARTRRSSERDDRRDSPVPLPQRLPQ